MRMPSTDLVRQRRPRENEGKIHCPIAEADTLAAYNSTSKCKRPTSAGFGAQAARFKRMGGDGVRIDVSD